MNMLIIFEAGNEIVIFTYEALLISRDLKCFVLNIAYYNNLTP